MNATQLGEHPVHVALVSCAVFWMTSIWVVAIRFGPLSMPWHGRLGLLVQTATPLRPFVYIMRAHGQLIREVCAQAAAAHAHREVH